MLIWLRNYKYQVDKNVVSGWSWLTPHLHSEAVDPCGISIPHPHTFFMETPLNFYQCKNTRLSTFKEAVDHKYTVRVSLSEKFKRVFYNCMTWI